jgi:deoxyribonuclease-4
MVKVGVHISIAGSIALSVSRAMDAGCDTYQIFSRNPRGWKFSDLDAAVVREFRNSLGATRVSPVVDHMPYLPNLAAPDGENYGKSVATLTAELQRCDQLGIPFLVTHLGHHKGAGKESGYRQVTAALNRALGEANGGKVMLLLETTANEKNSVGGTFEDLRAILDGIDERKRVGICYDTCHTFSAGYDIRTLEALGETLDHFNEVVGLSLLHAVHLNDACGELGGHLDRHEHIGLGSIGEEGFRTFLHHPVFRKLPLICETPVDERRDDRGNIAKVRELAA